MQAQDKNCGKKYPQQNEHSKENQVYHLIQGAIFRALLKRDRFRDWPALSAAWASWMYNDLHPWLQEHFSSEESWLTYAYAIIDGRRPFPWPDEMKEADRLDESLRMVQQTLAWVAVSDPQRVAIVMGSHLPVETPYQIDSACPTTQDLSAEFTRASSEIGDVAHSLCKSLQDGHVDANEAHDLARECEEAIAELGRLKNMAETICKSSDSN